MVDFLNNIKIGTRVGIGFFSVLAILIATSLFNLGVFSQFDETFSRYATVSQQTVDVLEVDKQISEIQRSILSYSNTGNISIIDRAKKIHEKLEDSVSDVKSDVEFLSTRKKLDSMQKILRTYRDNIEQLVYARKERDNLIDYLMKNLSVERVSLIKKIQLRLIEQKKIDDLYSVYFINEKILIAQINALSFLNVRKYELQKKTKKALLEAKRSINKLVVENEDSRDLLPLFNNLYKNVFEYENVFFKVVQATRDYLFLVNVVMAGEASEFSTLSYDLKKTSTVMLDEFTDLAKDQIAQARASTTLIAILAVFVSVVLGGLINRSLSKPIREISAIFGELAKGHSSTVIPGLNRGDEIGQLAKSANVFKEVNERTNVVLKESQELANTLMLREKELKERSSSLQKSNEELDNFAYIASHDLKSPLRGIDNLCEWVTEDCENILPDESKEHLKKMRNRITRMETLLADLLNYSRVGRIDVRVDQVDITELIAETVEIINKPESFVIEAGVNFPVITTQVSPLQQVFLNLLSNAVNYNDKEKGRVRITHRICDNSFIEFSLADNGPGIDPKFHERIFRMFETLQPRDVIESSGMGLAIIKKVVEGQGGRVSVESQLEKGSTFKFTWPLKSVNN